MGKKDERPKEEWREKYEKDLDKAINEAMNVDLEATKSLVRKVEKSQSFSISSKYKSINGHELNLKRRKNGYQFYCPKTTSVKDEVKVNQGGYWFCEKHDWVKDDLRLSIPDGGITKVTTMLGGDFSCRGPIQEFRLTYPLSFAAYRRFIVRIPKGLAYNHHKVLQNIRFAYGRHLRTGGMCVFNCHGITMRLFSIDDKSLFPSLIIDTNRPLKHDSFMDRVNAILTVFGAISGEYHRSEHYTIAARDSEFRNLIGLFYNKGKKSIITGQAWLDGYLWQDVVKKNYHLGYLPMNVFSNLVTKSFVDEKFARALRIIGLSNDYPLEIRASAYSVALETMKNIIVEENEEKFNPFKTKAASRRFRKACIAELEKIAEKDLNNKPAIVKRIDSFNQTTNKDSFEIAFSLVGVRLNEHDKRVIAMRNDFLHGRIPFEDEDNDEERDPLFMITYKLQFLLSALILRYSGFRGGIRNNYVYVGVKNKQDVGSDALFR